MVNCDISNKSENNLSLKTVDTPLKWCSVSLSDVISRGKRLEAAAYDVLGKAAIQTIQNSKFGFINLLSNNGIVKTAYHAPRFKRNYVEKTRKIQ